MASAWGSSWGSAWGSAWGAATVTPEPPANPSSRRRIAAREFNLPAELQDEAEIIAILTAIAPLLNRTP